MHFFYGRGFLILYVSIFLFFGCVTKRQVVDQKTNIADYSVLSEKQNLEDTDILDDIVSKALLNSGKLKHAYRTWQAAVLEVKSISKLPDPVFTYANYLESVETKVGPQEQSFALMQKIPFFGKLRAREEKAYFKALQKQKDFEDIRLNLIYDVKSVYYEYVYWKHSVDLLKKNQKLLQDLEEVVSVKYKTGEADNSDVLKIQIQAGDISERLISLGGLESVLKEKLNSLLNLDTKRDVNIKVVSMDTLQTDVLGEEVAMRLMLDRNPQLNKLRYILKGAESAWNEAKLGFYPDISLGATYIETGNADNNVIDNGKDPVLLLCSVNLPLNVFATRDNVKAKKEILSGYNDLLETTALNLKAELTNILYQVNDAKRKITLYEDNFIPKAKQILTVSSTSYKAGKYSFASLIDDEKRLLDFQMQLLKEKLKLLKAVASLEKILAGNLKKE